MITSTGKEIIAKYLIGTAPSYAAYIAVGCGAKPRKNVSSVSGASSSAKEITVSSTENLWVGAKISILSGTGVLSLLGDSIVTAINTSTKFTINLLPQTPLSGAVLYFQPDPAKQVLDFEMFRIPITSKGYANDSGINKIIFTAELPTEERYEISEIGIFSAGSNSEAAAYDSRTITPFASTENWQFNNGSTIVKPTIITEKITNSLNDITDISLAIQTNANNLGFLDETRSERYERCRYLNNIIMLRGNTSNLTGSAGVFTAASGAKFLQLSGQSVDLSKNSTADIVKIAFSLVNLIGNSVDVPDKARVLVEFSNNDGTQYARMSAEVTDVDNNFGSNRYFVVSKRLDQLSYSSATAFSWKNVTTIKIYCSVLVGTTPSDQYFVALDAIRVDNVSSVNPLYGMTGYSIIQNANADTIIKTPNTNNYIEFRVVMDVT